MGSTELVEAVGHDRAPALAAEGAPRTGVSVVVGTGAVLGHPGIRDAGRFRLGGVELVAALFEIPAREFDPSADENAERVLIEIDAFSCNYRDRGILLRSRAAEGPARLTPTGSEFCARVIATGPLVEGLGVGDRVFGTNEWPQAVAPGVHPGIPTNHASRRHHRLHFRQLVRVPDAMSSEDAAAFTLGAQTGYAMVRRLGLASGDTVLVTAASSATSQFAIGALANDPARPRIVALSTSAAGARAARDRGAHDVVLHARCDLADLGESSGLANLAGEAGGFAAIVDPFHDLYLPDLCQHLRGEGRYISCGVVAQYAGAAGSAGAEEYRRLREALMILGQLNATFIGNCLGSRTDLDRALADHAAGRMTVPLDSVHTGSPAQFLERSWIDPGRVGKVVYRYQH